MSAPAVSVGTPEPSHAIARAVRLMQALRLSNQGGSARELAAATGIARSTAQRILIGLAETGMVVQDQSDQRYRIGPLALWIGLGYRQSMDIVSLARPIMTRLRDVTGETVGLCNAVGDARAFIEEAQSRSGLRYASELGRLYPLWCGASGRVLMSGLSHDEIDRILADETLIGEVDHPLPIEENRRAILQARENGFATAFDETIAGSSSLAVPIVDASQMIVAAISMSGPQTRLTRDRMMDSLELVRESAHELSRQLGAAPEPAHGAASPEQR